MTEAQLRQKVVDTINGWVGSSRGDAKHKEILSIYNGQNPLPSGYRVQQSDAHCATTVSAAWIKAGIFAYTGTECSVQRFIDIARKRGIWTEDDAHVPMPGDAMCYDWQDSGAGDNMGFADHIGMVTACDGKTIWLTEGNINGGKVGKLSRAVNSRYIRGFITPDYAAISKALSGTETQAATISKGAQVRLAPAAELITGGRLAQWCYGTIFDVLSIRSDGAVVIGLNGQITAAVRKSDLALV